jgi:hypothetical protein
MIYLLASHRGGQLLVETNAGPSLVAAGTVVTS